MDAKLPPNPSAGPSIRQRRTRTTGFAGATALLALSVLLTLPGCAPLPPTAPDATPDPASPPQTEAATPAHPVASVRLITAQTAAVRSYRRPAAQWIYKKYPTRLYPGKIPPLVHAVVVVETDVDAQGKVVNVSFSRVPSHAPDVPPLIAEMIRKASPLPHPGKLGAHTYVDTWLWDKSGRFQLDTLTEGQRSR